MSISIARPDPNPVAINVAVDDASLRLVLADGREISAPLEWFPRLRDASGDDRANWRLIGRGQGIHWPALDEDVSVRMLLGLPS
jgi:hypothetical protein